MSAGATTDERSVGHYRLGRVLVAGERAFWTGRVPDWLQAAGFDVHPCDAREVLVRFEQVLPDVVVLAAELSRPDTLAACQWIHARSTVPLVVISQSSQFDPVDVLARGADIVLRPSVSERELVARVRVLLRRSPARVAPAQRVLAFGGIVLDRDRHHVQLPDGAIELEGRDLDLLHALLTSAPKLTSRHALRDLLREDDAVLDRCVRRLREQLEAVEGWRRIVTVRGVGFRLLEQRPADDGPGTVIQLPAEPVPAVDWTDQRSPVTIDLTERAASPDESSELHPA